MRHFLGDTSRSFIPGELRTFIASEASASMCGGALPMELLNLADRFGAVDPRGISIALSLSHELLGGLVGASRQQVTEYLSEFNRDRIIFRDGRRIIIDPEKLQKILKVVA
jgi:CRP-like cAMP-binding protein